MAAKIHMCTVTSAEFINDLRTKVQIDLQSHDDGQIFNFRMSFFGANPSHIKASKRQIQYFLGHTDSEILNDDALAELVGKVILIKYKGNKISDNGYAFKALDTPTEQQWVKEANRRCKQQKVKAKT